MNILKFNRSHPINILEKISRFLILLFLPLLRAIISGIEAVIDGHISFVDWLYDWGRGSWFDILTVFMIVLLGFFSWFSYVYNLSEDGILIRQGFIFIRYRFINYKKISVITIENTYYLRPFKAAKLSADTDGGGVRHSDFEITMRRKQVEELISLTKNAIVRKNALIKTYHPKNFHIAVLSFLSSNSLTGVLFVYALVTGASKIFGQEVEDLILEQITTYASIFASDTMPLMTAVLTFLIIIGWFISFSKNLIRHLKFTATRHGGLINITSGVGTKHEYNIATKRINLVELRQNLVTKLFGLYTTLIHSNGYGKKKDELSVLMPAGSNRDITINLEVLVPEIPFSKRQIKPKVKYLTRILMPTGVCIIATLYATQQLIYRFQNFSQFITYVGFMCAIGVGLYFIVKIISFFHTGIGSCNKTFTLYYTKGLQIKTISVPKNRIVKTTVKRSFFQLMAGSCDVVFYTSSEGTVRHKVPNMNYNEAKHLIGLDMI